MKLLSAEQIAELFQVKPRTIKEKLICRPDFPKPYRPSKRKLLWDECEVLDFVKSSRE